MNQVNSFWELKLGSEITRYTIRTYTVEALNLYRARFNGATDSTSSDWKVYNGANVSMYGYDIYGNEFDGGMFTDKTGYSIDLSQEGPRHPVFFGTYIQNKFEFNDLIMNIGIRYDILDPGGSMYKDPQNLGISTYAGIPVISDSSFVSQDLFTQLSPRIGLSFPVTDRTVFHTTYGKYIQFGRLGDLYDTRMAAGRFLAGGTQRRFPNPNLAPERTTQYEMGITQQLGDIASFGMTFFYKDIKDLHVIRVVFPDQAAGKSYTSTVNGDYGTIKGLTLNFNLRRTNHVSIAGNYTFSSSMATGSSSTTHFDIAWQDNSFNGQAYFPVIPAPTEFDRTHEGNIDLDYRFEKNDGPTLFGVKPFERLGANLLFTFSSGARYTLSDITGAFPFSQANGPNAHENLNTSTGPWIYQMDLKIDKTFDFFNKADLNIYLWIQNLFDRKNITDVYTGTGQPDNDGYFKTDNGKQWIANNGSSGIALYNYLQNNLGFYGPPRIVRFGAMINWNP